MNCKCVNKLIKTVEIDFTHNVVNPPAIEFYQNDSGLVKINFRFISKFYSNGMEQRTYFSLGKDATITLKYQKEDYTWFEENVVIDNYDRGEAHCTLTPDFTAFHRHATMTLILKDNDKELVIQIPYTIIQSQDFDKGNSSYYDKSEVNELLDQKVDKKLGYGLSQNDFTNEYKNKIDTELKDYQPEIDELEKSKLDKEDAVGKKTEYGGEIFNDYENNKAYSQYSSAHGNNNITGVRGYLVVNPDDCLAPDKKSFYVLYDGNDFGYEVDDVVSLQLEYNFMNIGKILSIENVDSKLKITISVDSDYFKVRDMVIPAYNATHPELYYIYCFEKPDVGNVSVMPSSTVFGSFNTVIGNGAGAFGKNNNLNGKYAIASGKGNYGEYADTLFGRNNLHRGENSFLVGDNNSGAGESQIVLGTGSGLMVGSSYSVAIGHSRFVDYTTPDGKQITTTKDMLSYLLDKTSEEILSIWDNLAAKFTYAACTSHKRTPSYTLGMSNLSIGEVSLATGLYTAATGYTATAMGWNTRSLATGSMAVNVRNTANHTASFITGSDNISTNSSQLVTGIFNDINTDVHKYSYFSVGNGTSKNNRSTAFSVGADGKIYIGSKGTAISQGNDGVQSLVLQSSGRTAAYGDFSIVTGGLGRNIAYSANSIAIGREVISYSPFAVALGYKCTAGAIEDSNNKELRTNPFSGAGRAAYAFGWYNTASAVNSFAMGVGTLANKPKQIALGAYNKETDAIFVIGNGWQDANRSNAFEIFNDGHAELTTTGSTGNSVVLKDYVDNLLNNKVDKVAGKQLSTNDYTDTDKANVDKIPIMEQSLESKANLSAVEQLIATETQERKDADTSLNERIAQRVPIVTVHRPSVYYTDKDSSTGVLFVAKTEQLREPETVPVYSANNTLVTSAPQSDNDATNKKYVDNAIASAITTTLNTEV